MTVHTRVAKPLVDSLRKALTSHALPGETKDLTRDGELEAAEFLAGVAVRRRKGEVALSIESTGGEAGRRRMRTASNSRHAVPVYSIAHPSRPPLTIHRLCTRAVVTPDRRPPE